MAELQQPNIVGNFLAAYSSGLERQQQQQDAAYQRQRQAKADQMTEQKYNFDMDAGQLDMAVKRASALNEILAGVDERNPQTLEVAKQRYMTSFGGRPEDVASITMADIPRIKMQTGQTLKELQIQAQKANIAQSLAAARASDRANRPEAAPTVKLPPTAIQTQDGKTLAAISTEASAAGKIAATLRAAQPAIEQGFTGPAFGAQRMVAGVASVVPFYQRASSFLGGEDRIANNINVYDRIDQASKISGIEALKGIGGSDTERELQTAIQTGVSPDLLPEENKRRMRSQIRAAEILGDKEEMAAQYLQTYGTLAPQSLPQGTPSFQSVWRKYQRQQWNEHLQNEKRIEQENARRARQENTPVEPKKPIITRVK